MKASRLSPTFPWPSDLRAIVRCIPWLQNLCIALYLQLLFASLNLQFTLDSISGNSRKFMPAPGTFPLKWRAGYQHCVSIDGHPEDSRSQFVTAAFHTLTSCSLVPPK